MLAVTAAGGLIGAYADKDDRGTGALVGAGLGLAGLTGFQGYKNLKASPISRKIWKHTPFKGGAAAVVAGAGAFAFGMASNPTAYESESSATPDGMGSYNSQVKYQNYKYSLSDRIASMNVSGDLVFGLHNKRHG